MISIILRLVSAFFDRSVEKVDFEADFSEVVAYNAGTVRCW
jgi:hypothetical protein